MNRISLTADGPLHCTGEIDVATPDAKVLDSGQEFWFCRCGASRDKPFCDGSHRPAGFKDTGKPLVGELATLSEGPLTIALRIDGPPKPRGPLEIIDVDGVTVWRGSDTALCRCGASKTKPFCDGTHRQVGFKSD